MRGVKGCMDGKLERLFSLGGHGRPSDEVRSLHSVDVLPRAESLQKTINGFSNLPGQADAGIGKNQGIA